MIYGYLNSHFVALHYIGGYIEVEQVRTDPSPLSTRIDFFATVLDES